MRTVLRNGGRLAGGLILGLAALLAGGSGTALGLSYTVTTTGDAAGECKPVATTCATLREAIEAVNKTPAPPDIINAPAGSITLTLGALPLETAMTIQGAGPGAGTTINANKKSSVITISSTPVKTNTGVTLAQLNLIGGAAERGGAVDATTKGILTLNLEGGTVKGNSAVYGGGIAIETGEDSSINVANETFASNTAEIGGGAIQFEPKTTTLSAIAIFRSTFTENVAGEEGEPGGAGGAIRFEPLGGGSSALNVDESTFANNAALGGPTGGGEGGAIRFEFGISLTARESTFSGNRVTGNGGEGGAIRDESGGENSLLILENSTLAGNSAPGESGEGGAIRYFGEPSVLPERDTALINDTVVGNTVGPAGTGAAIHGAENLHIWNTIITGNTAGGSPGDCNAPALSSDHSLSFGSNSCGLDLSGNPLLGPLANNGGPTLTMMPGEGSAAIDAGDGARCPTNDQRLVARPNDFGTVCDIGAVESGLATGPPGFPYVPPPPNPMPISGSLPPSLTNAVETNTTWRLGHKLAVLSRKRPPVGTTFSFTLNEPASVSLSFTRVLPGRRDKHHCLAETPHNHHRPACARSLAAGTLTVPGHPGTDKVAFQGRISAGAQLRPGHYKVAIRAKNSAGQASQTATLSFTVAG
jgi:hypothetical protein